MIGKKQCSAMTPDKVTGAYALKKKKITSLTEFRMVCFCPTGNRKTKPKMLKSLFKLPQGQLGQPGANLRTRQKLEGPNVKDGPATCREWLLPSERYCFSRAFEKGLGARCINKYYISPPLAISSPVPDIPIAEGGLETLDPPVFTAESSTHPFYCLQ